MPIKFRILLVVLLLQAGGFVALLLTWQHASQRLVGSLRDERLGALLAAEANRIDALTSLMERSALGLAALGEALQRQRALLGEAHVDAEVEARLREHIRRFPEVLGGGLWFEPGRFQPGRALYGPYAFWDGDRVQFTWELSSPDYHYPTQLWYLAGLPPDWPRTRRRPEPVYWTEPYYDEAGSEALMMTVDAPMYAADDSVLGMATIDWSVEDMQREVGALTVGDGALPFLIEPRSGRFLVYAGSEQRTMQPARLLAWGERVLGAARAGELGVLDQVVESGARYRAYYTATRIGLVVGALVPEQAVEQTLRPLLRESLVAGAAVALGFVLLMLILLGLLFRPFERLLAQIAGSVRRSADGEQLLLSPLRITGRNELTPIVEALNQVYDEVGSYTERLAAVNEHLRRQREEIGELNASLERKVNERTYQLEANNAELHRTIEQLRRAQHDLVEAEKHGALSRLVAGVAHEINTPLGIAVTAASHLAQSGRELEQKFAGNNLRRSEVERYFRDGRESLDILTANLERAANLVRSFKQVSVDQSSEARRQFDFAAYLEDILLSLRPRLKRLPHKVEIDCAAGLQVDSYPGAWSQVITNLIINSLIHGLGPDTPGHIRIAVSARGGRLELEYRDDGRGIAAENLPHVFDPFFTTNRAGGGSGLGLAVVYSLVTRTLGGTIELQSSPGKGVLFRIVAPLPSP
jgi:signal transduction histidine kinase